MGTKDVYNHEKDVDIKNTPGYSQYAAIENISDLTKFSKDLKRFFFFFFAYIFFPRSPKSKTLFSVKFCPRTSENRDSITT